MNVTDILFPATEGWPTDEWAKCYTSVNDKTFVDSQKFGIYILMFKMNYF